MQVVFRPVHWPIGHVHLPSTVVSYLIWSTGMDAVFLRSFQYENSVILINLFVWEWVDQNEKAVALPLYNYKTTQILIFLKWKSNQTSPLLKTCSGSPLSPELTNFHHGKWGSLWLGSDTLSCFASHCSVSPTCPLFPIAQYLNLFLFPQQNFQLFWTMYNPLIWPLSHFLGFRHALLSVWNAFFPQSSPLSS